MKKIISAIIYLFMVTLFIIPLSQASDKVDTEIIVEKAATVVKGFANNESLKWFNDTAKKARALLIIPKNIKGAFLVGGAGGSGVLVAKDKATGEWGQPAFYTLGSISVGVQFGAEASEVILMVMTDRGMESLLTSSFKLGADVSVSAGPEGAGVTAKTADILSFSRSQGAFFGMSFDGAVIKTRAKWNEAYYGKKVSPAQIMGNDVENPHSENLRKAITEMTKS